MNIFGKVDFFASFELFGGFQNNWVSVVIGVLVVTGEANAGDIFAAFGNIGIRYFVFYKDGVVGAFWDAGATINASIGVNIEKRILFLGGAGNNTFDWANFNTATVPKA